MATAKLFIDEGARVIVTGRTTATIKIAQAELGDLALLAPVDLLGGLVKTWMYKSPPPGR
ncbi:MAG: hypothetical protein WBV28_04695 [Terracidiphilus sp.]